MYNKNYNRENIKIFIEYEEINDYKIFMLINLMKRKSVEIIIIIINLKVSYIFIYHRVAVKLKIYYYISDCLIKNLNSWLLKCFNL
jgi:hypothetical protein